MNRRTGLRRPIAKRARRLTMEALETRITPTSRIWDGGVSDLWSVPANWSEGIAPVSGDDLVFPSSGSIRSTTNDFASGTEFGSITLDDSGYSISGNSVALTGGVSATYATGLSLLSIDVALGSGTVTVDAGASLEIDGQITGSMGLGLSGGGTLVLGGSADNIYTGQTKVDSGELHLGKVLAVAIPGNLTIGDGVGADRVQLLGSDQIADASIVTLDSSASLDLDGHDETIASIELTAASVSTGTGTLTVTGDVTSHMADTPSTIAGKLALPAGTHTFMVADPPAMQADLEITADISGSGDIYKTNTGRLGLSGNNSFTGTVDITDGSVQISHGNALGDPSSGTTVRLGAELDIFGGIDVAEPISIFGSGAMGEGALRSLQGDNTISADVTLVGAVSLIGVDADSLTLSGAITGGIGVDLAKFGPGTLVTTGESSNGFGGNVTVREGTLILDKDGVTAIPHNLTVGDGVHAATVIWNKDNQIAGNGSLSSKVGAIVDLHDHSDTVLDLTIDNSTLTTGTGTLSLLGDLRVSDNGLSTPPSIAGALNLEQFGATFFQYNGPSTGAALQLSAVIGGSTPQIDLYATDDGVRLSGQNTFLGTLIIHANTVFVTDASGLGSAASGTVVEAGGALAVDGSVPFFGPESLTLNGSGVNGTGALRILSGDHAFTAPITLASPSNIRVETGARLTDYGQITDGVGSSQLSKSGQGVLEFYNANPFDGGTVIYEGVVTLFNGAGLGTGYVNVQNGATLELSDVSTTYMSSLDIAGTGVGGNGAIRNLGGFSDLSAPITLLGNALIRSEAGATLALGGAISDGGNAYGLTFNGGGSYLLNGSDANTYTGETSVISGTLNLNKSGNDGAFGGDLHIGSEGSNAFVVFDNANQIPDDANVTVQGEFSSLLISGYSDTIANLTLDGGSIDLGTNGGFAFSQLDLTDGTFSLPDGSVVFAHGDIHVNAGSKGSNITGTGNFNLDTATKTFTVADGSATVDLEVSAQIGESNPGISLIKAGAGTMRISGSNPSQYSGRTSVDAGTLELNLSNTGFESQTILGDLDIGDGVGTGARVVLLQGKQIADSSSVTVRPGATLDLNNLDEHIGGLTLRGASVLTGGTDGRLQIDGDLSALSNSQHLISEILGPGTIDLHSSGGMNSTDITVDDDPILDVELRIGTAIEDSLISKLGAGSIALAGASGSTFGSYFAQGGTTYVENNDALGDASADTHVADGASIVFRGSDYSIAEPFHIAGNGQGLGALYVDSGATRLTGPVSLLTAASNSRIGANDSATLTVDGVIDDAGAMLALEVVNGTFGRTTLAGDNQFSGNLSIVGAGVTQLANSGAAGTAGLISVASGNTLELVNNISLPASKSIQLSGVGAPGLSKLTNASGDNTIGGSISLVSDQFIDVHSGSSLTVNGFIGGASYVVFKEGTGTLDLRGNNPVVGLFVDAGTLLINGDSPVSINGVQVFSGSTLGGSGTTGAIQIFGGATLSPGNSPGILTSGNASLNTGSTFLAELNGTTVGTEYDQLDVTGSVILSSPTLSLSLGYAPSVGDSFVIINNDGTDSIDGTFAGLPEGSTITLGVATLRISYVGGSNGNDVVLDVTDVTYTWDGGGSDNNWSTAANWDTDIAPTIGASLVFPDGTVRRVNTNDFAAGTQFKNLTIGGPSYQLVGNSIKLDGDITTHLFGSTSEIDFDIELQASTTIYVDSGGFNVAGAISGVGFGVTKTGPGDLTYFAGTSNTYTGTTFVNAGSLSLVKIFGATAIAGDLSIGDQSGGQAVVLFLANQIADTSKVTVNEGASFSLNGQEEAIDSLTLQGATVQTGPGGVLKLNSSLSSKTSSVNSPSTITGPGALDLNENSAFSVDVEDLSAVSGDLRIDVVVQNGGIIKSGPGTLALAAANTFAGSLNVSGGVVQVENNNALGTTDGDTTVSAGASVVFSGVSLNIGEDFNIQGSGSSSSGVLNVHSGSTSLTGTLTLASGDAEIHADGSLSIDGVIDDQGTNHSPSYVAGPSGRISLGGSNTYTGDTNIVSGRVIAQNENAFGQGSMSSTVEVQSGATLELSGGLTFPATRHFNLVGLPVANFSKLANTSGENTIQGGLSLSQNNQSIDVASGTKLTIEGPISGSVDIDKNGPGVLVLTGTSSMTGNQNVGDGTLLVDGDISSNSLVFVDGTLGGSGTVPSVVVSGIGTIAPGTSTGILHSGDVDFTGGSSYRIELDGATAGSGYDQLDVIGNVILENPTLSISLGFSPSAGSVFTIINNDGSDAVSGTFNGLAEGSDISIGGKIFRISYVGGSGNDVTLTYRQGTTTNLSLQSTGVVGESITITATLLGDASVPSGTVTFSDGAEVLAVVALDGSGVAALTTTGLGLGSHSITATFNGSLADITSLDLAGIDIGQASTAATVFGAVNPSVVGQAVTLTAQVTIAAPGSGTADGTVAFMDGATLLGIATVDGSGVATLTTSSLAVGSHPITVIYGGSANFLASTSLSTDQIVEQASTVLILNSSAPSSVVGETVTFFASVSVVAPGSGTPSGVVSFFDGAVLIGTSLLDGSGSTSLTTAGLGVGSHSIQALYLGSTDFQSTSTFLSPQVVNPAATTATVFSSVASSVFGQSVTFTAALTVDAPGNGVITGNVGFFDTGVLLGIGSIDASGMASITVGELAVGAHSIQAQYFGDVSFLPIASSPITQLVDLATTTISVVASANPSVSGQPVDLFASVFVSNPGSGIASGLVSFYDGATLIGNAAIDASGSASITVPGFLVGTRPITAVYLGDLSFAGSTSPLIHQQVDQASTHVTITPFTTSFVYGEPVTITAVVAVDAPSQSRPSGIIEIYDGATLLGSATPDLAGTVQLTVSSLGVGVHSITARATGDSEKFDSTSDPLSLTIDKDVATIALSASSTTSTYGDLVSFSTLVGVASPGTAIATGVVVFLDGSTPIGSVDLNELGIAVFTTSSLNAGTHSLHAVYLGNDLVSPSGPSNTFVETVDRAVILMTAESKVREYGDANPTLTATFSGFKNGELLGTSDVAGAIDLSTVAMPSSPVAAGPFAITAGVGTLSSNNYDFVTQDGTLTVVPASLVVRADSATREYGDVNPTLTASFSGFKNGESLATSDVVGSPMVTTSATPQSRVSDGPFAVNVQLGSLASSNYAISTADSTLTITRAHLTIAADSAIREYGDSNPTLTASIEGFKNGEMLATSDVVGTPSLTTQAVPTSPVLNGPYAIVAEQGSLASGNYDFAFTGSSLQVTPAPLLVTADSVARPFGAANPTFTASYSGFKNGENRGNSDLGGNPGLSSLAGPHSPVNASPIAILASVGSLTSGNYALSFADGTLSILSATSSTALSSSANPAVFGHAVTLTAHVSADSPSSAVPTGTVTFREGSTVLAVVTLDVNGLATYSTSQLSTGGHSITAEYSGDSNILAGPIADLIQAVDRSATSTTLDFTPGTVFGQSVTLTATISEISPGSGTAGGTVEFFDGPNSLGIVLLNASGQAVLDVASLQAGLHSIASVYSGDGSFQGSASSIQSVSIGQAATSLTVSSTGNTEFGSPVTFTASVAVLSPGVGIPQGIVTFYDGVTPLGSAAIAGNGMVQITTSSLAIGSHTITALYSGSANFSATSGEVAQIVGQIDGAVTLDASNTSTKFGQVVTLTANVPQGTGSVTFADGSTTLGTALVSGGIASLSTSALAVGSHSIVATYSGDSTVSSASSQILSIEVAKSSTNEVVASSGGSTVYGQAVTFTATVIAAAPGSGTPTGSFAFYDGTTLLGTSALDENGIASIQVASLTVGSHAIVTVYDGDGSFNGGTSDTIAQVVAVAATSATVNVLGGSVVGESATITAQVTISAPGVTTPTGTVLFLDGATVIGSTNVDELGFASISLSGLSVGSHAISASYLGDGTTSASTSPTVTQSVSQAASTISVTTGPAVIYGTSTVFTATIVTPSSVIPSGTVTFFDGATVVGVVPVVSGTASLTSSSFSVGAHSISAVYSGDASVIGSTSSPATQTINAAPTAITILVPTASVAGQTVTLGASVSTTATGVSQPSGTVTFLDGSTILGVAELVNGSASLSDATLTSGAHAITATFSGDATYLGSTSGASSITVTPAKPVQVAAITTIASADGPTRFGQPVLLTANVSGGAGSPSGTVTFLDGDRVLGTAELFEGAGSISVSNFGTGEHVITARYSGSELYLASLSAPSSRVVLRGNSTTTLIVAPNPSVHGKSATYTAVLSTETTVPATGIVRFFDGETLLGTSALTGQVASISSVVLGASRSHSIRAVYSGDGNFDGSTSSALSQTVQRAETREIVTLTIGRRKTIVTVTVTSPAAGTPTGDLVFTLNGRRARRVSLANGRATFELATAARGVGKVLGLTYQGDADHANSTSTTLFSGRRLLNFTASKLRSF